MFDNFLGLLSLIMGDVIDIFCNCRKNIKGRKNN